MGSVFFKSGKDKVLTKVQSFFDLSAKDIDGNLISFSTFKQNKAFIVVNVASSCSFTRPAYKELVKLYDDYQFLKIYDFHKFSI
jgi:glutathione peroxidase-family protein